MLLYRYDTDVDRFSFVEAVGSDVARVMKLHYCDEPQAGSWTPIQTCDHPDYRRRTGDFPSLNNFSLVPILSARAWTALRPIVEYCCEALPVNLPSGEPHFLIHVMETIDCLDVARSKVSRNDATGRVNDVFRYAFRKKLIVGKHIFKLPPDSGAELIVDEEFRRCVQLNHLKGLRFKAISALK